VNTSETVNTRYGYDVWGDPTQTLLSGNVTTRYQFTGRSFDSTSGLYNYWARHYDHGIGRFTSRDPLYLGTRGHVDSYIYVRGNPATLADPSGLDYDFGGVISIAGGFISPCWTRGADCMQCCSDRQWAMEWAGNWTARYFTAAGVILDYLTFYQLFYRLPTTLADAMEWAAGQLLWQEVINAGSNEHRFRYWAHLWGDYCRSKCPKEDRGLRCPIDLTTNLPEENCCDKDHIWPHYWCCDFGRTCEACRAQCGDNVTPCNNDSGAVDRRDFGCGQWYKCETGTADNYTDWHFYWAGPVDESVWQPGAGDYCGD